MKLTEKDKAVLGSILIGIEQQRGALKGNMLFLEATTTPAERKPLHEADKNLADAQVMIMAFVRQAADELPTVDSGTF
jgi:hypothetical protein